MDKEYRLIIEPVAKPLEAQLFFLDRIYKIYRIS